MVGMVSRRCFLPVPSASLGSSQLGRVSWPHVSQPEDVEQRPDVPSWSCVLGSSELPRRVCLGFQGGLWPDSASMAAR